MKQKDSTIIGDVYVKLENDSLFRNLYIVNNSDTIYSIRDTVFSNKAGVDIQIPKENVYYYQLSFGKNDYFVVSVLLPKSRGNGDDITIEWNYEKKRLEVLLTP